MDYHSVHNLISIFFPFLAISTGGVTTLIFLDLLLFFLSFFVAGSEIAFFSLSSKELNLLKTRGQPSFRRIALLMDRPKPLLNTLLITNVFANLGAILISSLLLDGLMEQLLVGIWVKFAIKIVAISFFLVLFAEVLPKVWATHHKLWFASTASLMIDICNTLFYGLSRRLVRLNDNIEKNLSPDN
ncbi:MAG: DUF21 domain-containing protein, partial [Ferruginibacter sp.]